MGSADGRRAFLKGIAARSAKVWNLSTLPPRLAGETRLETRNSVYRLRDGVCYRVDRTAERPPSADGEAFVGMRVVGWLMRDDASRGLSLEWRPGAHAVLWRPHATEAPRSSVAMTSPSIALRAVSSGVHGRAGRG